METSMSSPLAEMATLKEDGQLDGVIADAQEQSSPPVPVSLDALQSTEQRELMDLVGRLRRAGLNSLLQLPQIVVCGDQSSGKSSVLEAITEIPFPRKENLCTRFATEISMRRSTDSSISCKINPDGNREEGEKEKLRAFSRSIKDFNELPALIDDATALMGLGPSRAFSKDVLRIEICGPHRPQLTLVDLPGLIHTSSKSQSEEDVELIKSLIEEYICEKRTIILAIVSAKNDYANQIILKTCRKFDPKGARTLGVITKPDFLRPGSENEGQWLDLARNQDIYFQLGWHILKNRDDGEHQLSFMERNINERVFLSTGNYKALPQSMKGVDTLRQRLSKLLFDHLKLELPGLKAELDKITTTTHRELEAIGKSRGSLPDQRLYLTELSTSACDIIRMGVDGNYMSSFFGGIDLEAAMDEGQNADRLRAVTQHFNLQFADRMQTRGHKYDIDGESNKVAALLDSDVSNHGKSAENDLSNEASKMSREEAIQWVLKITKRSRGRELPGTFNPLHIGILFQEQSIPWEDLARYHINRVAEACKKFVLRVLHHVAAPEVKAKLENLTVLPAFKRAHEAVFNEFRYIMEDKSRHPITYNHYFTDTFQKHQIERFTNQMTRAAKAATVFVPQEDYSGNYLEKQFIDPETLHREVKSTIEQDMEKFAAEQALDAHEAYYKDERKYFIGVITKQAIERHLLSPLPDMISPKAMARYSDAEVQFVAAEAPEATQLRAHLESKMKILKDGQDAFLAAIGQHF